MFAVLVPWLLKTFIPGLADDALKALAAFVQDEMTKRALVQQGQDQQAATETAKTATTEAAMAQAEADAPTTKDAAMKRLGDGSA